MTIATQRRMSLEEYLNYDDGSETRYELVDGVLIEMGAENPLNPRIAAFLMFLFADLGVPRQNLVIGHQIGVSSTKATARQPDLIVHSDASIADIMADGKLLRAGLAAPRLVVEVASNTSSDRKSRSRDYEDKPTEYAERGIPELWIIDPDRELVRVGTLVDGSYQFIDFTGNQLLLSPTFAQLSLTAQQLLSANS